MKFDTYIACTLRGVLAALMFLSLSCANKETEKVESFDEAAAAEDATSSEGVEDGSDEANDGETTAEKEEDALVGEDGDKGMKELEDELAALDENADAMMGDENKEKEETDGENVDESVEGLEAKEGEEADAALEGTETAEAESLDEGLPEEGEQTTETPSTEGAEIAENVPEATPSQAVEPTPEPTPEPTVEKYQEPSDAPTTTATYGGSSTPTIPPTAFSKKGVWVNRFYFTRKGDNAASISNLIFGTTGKTGELAKVNGGAAKLKKPGTLVYYNSPMNPQDDRFQSFYKENNIAPEEYVVQKGETLSVIAKKFYGDWRSWKELAVVNGLENPDSVRRGQKLFAYPADLKSSAVATADTQTPSPDTQAKAPETAPPEPVAQAPEITPPPAPPEVVPEVPKPNPAPTAQAEDTESWGGIMGLLQQNLLFIAFGGLVVLALLGLMVVKRRRGQSEEGLGEQDFVEPPKAKRR